MKINETNDYYTANTRVINETVKRVYEYLKSVKKLIFLHKGGGPKGQSEGGLRAFKKLKKINVFEEKVGKRVIPATIAGITLESLMKQ